MSRRSRMTNRILVLTQMSLNAFFDSMTLSKQRAEPDNISACGCYFWRSERQWSRCLTSLIINKVNTLANHDWQSSNQSEQKAYVCNQCQTPEICATSSRLLPVYFRLVKRLVRDFLASHVTWHTSLEPKHWQILLFTTQMKTALHMLF